LILQDCDLALTYSTNQLGIEELVAQLRKDRDTLPDDRYVRITTHKCDLSDAEATTALCEEVRKAHGRPVEILISNAGFGKRIVNIWSVRAFPLWPLLIEVLGTYRSRILITQ